MTTGQMALSNLGFSAEIIKELDRQASVRGMSLRKYLKNAISALVPNKSNSLSPSGDPWYDVPENVEQLKKDIRESERPGSRELVFHTSQELEDYFNKLINEI